MGRIKDDERRLRAAMAGDSNAHALAVAMRLGINGRRARYLYQKIQGKQHRSNIKTALHSPVEPITEAPQPIEETTEPTEEQDGELQGLEWPGLDDQAGRPEDSADSD